ncbi:unnamed protein product, partial [Rotaria sp. Silwood2]
MIEQAKQFEWILSSLAKYVFKVSIQSINMFRDINGSDIAFNNEKALFFNLRYFEQVFAVDLNAYLQAFNSSNAIVSEIVNFYFVVTCHELAHNIYRQHDL